MSETIGECGDVSEERTQTPFPFLSLPAEIRNKIYRLVLLTQNITTDETSTDGIFRYSVEEDDSVGSVQPDEVAVGTIRCESSRTYTMGYQIAILLTNWQIYREAWGIFHIENYWTIIRVNKAGIGKNMIDHGFPVATTANLWRHVKFPVMKVMVTLPSLKDQKQSDYLVVATIHLKQLMRALWTAKGASEMEVRIELQPPQTKNSPGERYLLRPFFKLRSIKKPIVLGGSENAYVDELRRAITTTDGIRQTRGEVFASLKRQKLSFLNADYKTVYGNRRVIGMGPRLNMNTAMARNQIAKETLIATSMVSSGITLYLGPYASAIDSADLGLNAVARVFVFPHVAPAPPTIVAHPYHQLLITAGNETACYMLVDRARAYIDMQRAEDALRDIKIARLLTPSTAGRGTSSRLLALVSRSWQDSFGPLPSSAPSPSPVPL
ncbi:hypothetical protein MMC22_005933 [Lobaria immixta]|nr:hypothetical protein [Lobaria immixta]